MSSSATETLIEAALRVLNTADPFEKARLGDEVANKWLHGVTTQAYDPSSSKDLIVPDRPARLGTVSCIRSLNFDEMKIVFRFVHSLMFYEFEARLKYIN